MINDLKMIKINMKYLKHNEKKIFILYIVVQFLLTLNCGSSKDDEFIESQADINALFVSTEVVAAKQVNTVNMFRFFLESITLENESVIILSFNKDVDSVTGSNASNFSIITTDATETPVIIHGAVVTGKQVKIFVPALDADEFYRVNFSNLLCSGCSTETAEIKNENDTLFAGWSFRPTSALFESGKLINLTFTAAVPCATLLNVANYTVGSSNPIGASTDGGCFASASNVKLQFAESFALGNHELFVSSNVKSSLNQDLATNTLTLNYFVPSFRILEAKTLSSNSVVLYFNKLIDSTNIQNSNFSINNLVVDAFNVQGSSVILTTNTIDLSTDDVYLLSYSGIKELSNSSELSGKLGFLGLNTLTMISIESPDFNRIEFILSSNLDSISVENVANYTGTCDIQSSTLSSGANCSGVNECIILETSTSMQQCLFGHMNLMSISGKNYFFSQSGKVILRFKDALVGSGSILFGGRKLNYTTQDNRIFEVDIGYLTLGSHSLDFQGFSNKSLSLDALPLIINIEY